MYNNIQWVVQTNLTAPETLENLEHACAQLGVDYVGLEIIPFSYELPSFPRQKKSIFYGSTTTMNIVSGDNELKEGMFFNRSNFSMANYFHHWQEHMLNYGAVVTTFGEVGTLGFKEDKEFFIRPDDDSKSFVGGIMQYSELLAWKTLIDTAQDTSVTVDTAIVIAEPYNISAEWRLWIVNKKVVAASKYREGFRLKKERGCPPDVEAFAHERCKEYTPHDVFVMDVGLCGDQYYIIECGCMNSAGFYDADVHKIVAEVSRYFAALVAHE